MGIFMAILYWVLNALAISAVVYVVLYAMSPTIRKETWGTIYKALFSWWLPQTWAWIQTKMPKKKVSFDPEQAMRLSQLIRDHGEDHAEVKIYVEEHPELAFLVTLSADLKPKGTNDPTELRQPPANANPAMEESALESPQEGKDA